MGPEFTNAYTGLEEGAVVSAGGYLLRCVLTPGHTPGHMCLWEEKNQMMFTGDHVLFDITPTITVWGNLDDALGYYLESLEAIRRYPVKKALPGHRMSGDFHKRIDELLEHHEVRLGSILDIIRHEPGLTGNEIAGRMKWRIRAASWEEFPVAQKIFAVGECMSHLEYLWIRDKVKIEKDGEINHYHL
jgi:glyoxylase-like metal-dependent hydrolase (beta-lactamase superfamily II)